MLLMEVLESRVFGRIKRLRSVIFFTLFNTPSICLISKESSPSTLARLTFRLPAMTVRSLASVRGSPIA